MSRSVRLSTLAGALVGALAVAAFMGDPDALSAGLTAWAHPMSAGLALALVAGGAAGGAVLLQSLMPRRRRGGGGPSWLAVAGVLGLVAVLYGKLLEAPLRAAVGRVVSLIVGDGAA